MGDGKRVVECEFINGAPYFTCYKLIGKRKCIFLDGLAHIKKSVIPRKFFNQTLREKGGGTNIYTRMMHKDDPVRTVIERATLKEMTDIYLGEFLSDPNDTLSFDLEIGELIMDDCVEIIKLSDWL
ncbi:hypothetical protein Avbf_13609 [Armadillidium vulgare]|nr:hypothetical protein Avbf_13609 [Armadillidium vulgare]